MVDSPTLSGQVAHGNDLRFNLSHLQGARSGVLDVGIAHPRFPHVEVDWIGEAGFACQRQA